MTVSNIIDRSTSANAFQLENQSSGKEKNIAVTTLAGGSAVIVLSPQLTKLHQEDLAKLKYAAENSSINRELVLFLKALDPQGQKQLFVGAVKQVASTREKTGGNIKELAKKTEVDISEKIESGAEGFTKEDLEARGRKAARIFEASQTEYVSKESVSFVQMPPSQDQTTNVGSDQAAIPDSSSQKDATATSTTDLFKTTQQEQAAESKKRKLEDDVKSEIKESQKKQRILAEKQAETAALNQAEQKRESIGIEAPLLPVKKN